MSDTRKCQAVRNGVRCPSDAVGFTLTPVIPEGVPPEDFTYFWCEEHGKETEAGMNAAIEKRGFPQVNKLKFTLLYGG